MIYYLPVLILLVAKLNVLRHNSRLVLDILLYGYLFLLGAFKFKVGADYENYRHMYKLIISGDYQTDIVFQFLNIFSNFLNLGYRGVHIFTAAICTFTTLIFVRKKKISIELETLLVLFFIIVMSFGYLRQSIAVSFIMLSEIVQYKRSRLVFIAFALGSHLSSLIYIILRFFIVFDCHSERYSVRKGFFIVLIAALSVLIFILNIRDNLYAELVSNGVYFRITVYFLPLFIISSLIIIFKGKLRASVALPVTLLLSGSIASTLIDRVLVLFIPLIVLFHNQLTSTAQIHPVIFYRIFIIFIYFICFTLWLYFAPYGSEFWLYYKWAWK